MKLKELRKENKKTQEEIAKFLQVAQRTYGGYELGTSEPTIDTLCKLADYYGVTVDYLIGRDFANEFGYLSETEKNMLKGFRQLNQMNQYRLLGEIQGMLIVQD